MIRDLIFSIAVNVVSNLIASAILYWLKNRFFKK